MFKEGTLIDLVITEEGRAFIAPGCTDVIEGEKVMVDGTVLYRVLGVVSVEARDSLNELRRVDAVVRPLAYPEGKDNV